eukprot:TRINITY_DN2283_c0_g1_i1.p1 TRINITY_DN2283_c0_g1~~TRINITY_DN2283_c0_g1_i1.p1  ORF type:complete len:234 (-),score=72.86 TRINITY_DN2283_c0_g1_i1:515-1180(-)
MLSRYSTSIIRRNPLPVITFARTFCAQTTQPQQVKPHQPPPHLEQPKEHISVYRDTDVGAIMKEKAKQYQRVITVSPSSTVYDAIQKLVNEKVGAAVVEDEGKVVGMISERDYLNKVALEGKNSKNTLVKDIMSNKITTVNSENTADECMQLMTRERFRHLPVLENGKMIGLISIKQWYQRRVRGSHSCYPPSALCFLFSHNTPKERNNSDIQYKPNQNVE